MRLEKNWIIAGTTACHIWIGGIALAASPTVTGDQSGAPQVTTRPAMPTRAMISPVYAETSGTVLCSDGDGSIMLFAKHLPPVSRRRAYFGWIVGAEGKIEALGRLTLRKGGRGFVSKSKGMPRGAARVFVTEQRNLPEVGFPGSKVVLEAALD